MQALSLQPIQQKQRIAIVDILRGWALLGVALMNYVDYYYLGINWETFKPDMLTNILQGFGNIVFSAKSWTMLTFLFGYGFAVVMNNLREKGMNGELFYLRRMFWLFVLAFINSSFYFGDILKDYAAMGVIMLLFYRAPAKVTFITGIVLLLAMPAVAAWVNNMHKPGGWALMEPLYPYLQSHRLADVFRFQLEGTYRFEILSPGYLITVHVSMLSLMLLGVSAQRTHFFERLHENKKYVKRLFWSLLGASLLLLAYMLLSNKLKINLDKYYQPGMMFVILNMFFYVSIFCWLYVSGKLKAFFRSMQVIGKMTLTNYMTQNVIAFLLFSGFGFGLALKNRIHFGYYLLFAFVIYVAQVYLSKWWLSKYNYGPVEWIWRQLSYNKRLPIRKQTTTSEQETVLLEPALATSISMPQSPSNSSTLPE